MNNSYLARARQQITDPQVLAVVAAKRAKQLAAGGRPMIKCDSENLLDVALLEIAEGLLTYEFADEAAEEAGYTIKAYHGSRNIFTVFDKAKLGSNTKTETSKRLS